MCIFGKKKKPAPTPSPIVRNPQNTPLSTGVSVFGAWPETRNDYGCVPGTECPDTSQHPWDTFRTDDRHMSLMGNGRYDERDPAVTRLRDSLWSANDVAWVTYQVQHSHGQTRHDLLPPWICKVDPLLLRHCPDNHDSTLKTCFALSNWDVMATSGDRDAYWDSLISYKWDAQTLLESWKTYALSAASFMTRPNYQRVKGRPMLVSGAPEGMEYYATKFAVSPSMIDDVIRSTIRAQIGEDIYRVATSVDNDFRVKLRAAGYDAMTQYLLHGMEKSFVSMAAMYRHYWEEDTRICKQIGIEYIVPFTAGYDSRAWGSPVDDVAIPTAAQFEAHLREARTFARDNWSLTRGLLLGYAWNEIGEGGIIEPMMPGQLHSGDEILRAIKSASLTS